jgi:hypothetical protein
MLHTRRSTFAEVLPMMTVSKFLHVAATADGGDDCHGEHALGCDPSGCDPAEEVKADHQVHQHQHQHQKCGVGASSSSQLTHEGGKDEDAAHEGGATVGVLTKVDGAVGVLTKVDGAVGILTEVDGEVGVATEVDGANSVLGLGLKIGLQIDRHDVMPRAKGDYATSGAKKDDDMAGAKRDHATAGAGRDDHATGAEIDFDPAVALGVIDDGEDVRGDSCAGEDDDHVPCAAEETAWSVEVVGGKMQGEDVGGGEDLPGGCGAVAPCAHPCRNPSDGGQTSDGHTSDTTVQTVLSGASVQTVLTEEDSVPAGLWLSAADCDMTGSEIMLKTLVADNRHAKRPGMEEEKGQGSVKGMEDERKDDDGTSEEKIQQLGSVHVVEAAQYLRAKQAEIKLQVDSFNLAISRVRLSRPQRNRSPLFPASGSRVQPSRLPLQP